MIKRIVLAGPGSDPESGAAPGSGSVSDRFSVAWRRRVDAALDAPVQVRPLRITRCATVDDAAAVARHTGVGLEWYADGAHLERFEGWLARTDPEAAGGDASATGGPGSDPVILAAEHVLRGADWLERGWRDGETTFKHLAIARRAAGLTPGEFSERWRTGAGRVQTAGERPALVIPDDVRGCAYVQNHPLPRAVGEWAYDAVNEVSFEDIDGLRTRVEWFAEHVGAAAEPDLISQNWFLATTEAVLLPSR